MLSTMWWSDWFGGHGFVPWMFFGPAMMLIFFAVCIAMAYLLVRAGWRGQSGEGRAIDILRERFARGEIDQREFEERRRLLQG